MTKFKRKINKKVSAVLMADPHIRPDFPVCRTDDFFKSMENKWDFILALSKEHECPILNSGDLGHKSQWKNWLLEWFISKTEGYEIISICGQHDLLNHRLDFFEKSGIGVLHAAKAIKVIFEPTLINQFIVYPFHYGEDIIHEKEKIKPHVPYICMTHQMVIENKPLWPDQVAPKGNQLLKKYPEFELILSGDNHNAFEVEYEGRWLVNPGSLMRTTTEQINHKPRVYLWFAETNEIKKVYLPIEQNVISKTHIEVAKARENRNAAFVARINNDIEIDLSYENNLENYFKKYRTEKPIVQKVWNSVG